MNATNATIDIRRSDERMSTNIGWLRGRHSFSFGGQYDPKNVGHGLLLVNNEDIVAPGTGFDTHPHQDMEIVTWVLDGELERNAVLWGARLGADESVSLPDVAFAHLFVPKGSASLTGQPLLTSDAARLRGAGAVDLTAGPEGAEILLWAMGR